MQGLIVHPGVIDSDYTGQVKIMVSSPRAIVAISPRDRIAQLLLLPSCHSQFPAKEEERGDKGFGSTGTSAIFCSLDLDERPLLQLIIEGKSGCWTLAQIEVSSTSRIGPLVGHVNDQSKR